MADISNLKKSIDAITPLFEDLKIELDKYPNAFNLKLDKEKGYLLTIDLDVLEQVSSPSSGQYN
ncbi:hypothetical protein [Flavobacterium sp. GNP002]